MTLLPFLWIRATCHLPLPLSSGLLSLHPYPPFSCRAQSSNGDGAGAGSETCHEDSSTMHSDAGKEQDDAGRWGDAFRSSRALFATGSKLPRLDLDHYLAQTKTIDLNHGRRCQLPELPMYRPNLVGLLLLIALWFKLRRVPKRALAGLDELEHEQMRARSTG